MRYSQPSDFEHFVLKEDTESVDIDTSEACRLAALSMVRQAARSVEIVTRHLDPQMYDNADFCDAVSQLVVGSRRARVRALVRDTEPVIKNGHRLVPLSQRLPTFIELRVPAKEYDDYNAAFLIVDGTGIIYRRLSDRFEANVNFNNPRMAGELARQFEEMWQTAAPDVNLRRSHL
jgi:hypothetical protein